MVFHNETNTGKILFRKLNIGDVFITEDQAVFMKVEPITTDKGYNYNAICLNDGEFFCFCEIDCFYFAEADLHYKIQT